MTLTPEKRKLVILQLRATHAMCIDALDMANKGEAVTPAQLIDLVRRMADTALMVMEEDDDGTR